MEACKSQHAAADATSALRPVVGLQGGATQPSPAGKIRAMFTVPQVGSIVTTFFLFPHLIQQTAEFNVIPGPGPGAPQHLVC